MPADLVAELLILREDMPRSLHASMNFIFESLDRLCDESSGEIKRAAGELHAKLHYGKTDDIIRFGLHEYLMEFLEGISLLGDEINKDFLVPAYTSNAAPPDAAVQRQSSSQLGPQPLE